MTDVKVVKVVAPNNMGKGLVWNETTKQYEVNLEDNVANVAVLTGEIAHGGTIPLPAGFTQEQCKWIVTPIMIYDDVLGGDIRYFECHAIGTRVVTCLVEGLSVISPSNAFYQIIGVKQ